MNPNLNLETKNDYPKFNNPEEEIAYLRNEIERRQEVTKNFNERIKKEDLAKDVIREHLSQNPKNVLPNGYEVKSYKEKKLLEDLAPRKTDEKVSEIVSVMLDKGIHSAFKVVKDLQDREVESDFHRFLVNYLLINPDQKEIQRNLSKSDWKALNMRLYEITLVNVADDKEKVAKNTKEFIAFMEQFYANMLAISRDLDNKDNDYYTLEIAKPNYSNQVNFYVSVPKEMSDLFEKSVLALFPDISVKHSIDDYNIFSSNGFQLAAYGATLETAAMPLKTYEKMEGDPISFIMSAFTKLQKEGEAASFQIVVKPAGETFFKKYSSILDEMRKGETLKRVLSRDSFVKDFLLTFKEAAKDLTKGEKDMEKDKNKPKKLEDERALKNIEGKLVATIVDTNLRLVVNAQSLDRAKGILNELASTFRQYTETGSNSLQFKMLDGSRLNEMIHNFIYRIYDSHESLPLNLKELATLYYFPSKVKDFVQLKKIEAKSAPAPMDLPQEGLFVGVNNYRNLETKIFIPEKDRLRHMYIIGQTGTGKSVMLQNMIIQDILNGDGCCFIDPHGEDLMNILSNIPKERYEDVIYFDPAYTAMPMGLNMMEYDPKHPEQKIFVINELLSIFKKLFAESSPESMGPAFEQYFRNSAGLVMEHPESGCTLLDISRVLSDKEYRDYKLAHSKNPLINQFFRNAEATSGEQSFENFIPYITNKFDVFISNEVMRPIIAQEKSSFNISEIMDNRKIFLVNLSKGRLGELNANLIGLILVGKFLMAALGRENPAEKPPFYLYLDEFQNVATTSISAILSEARKYKLSLTMAHQYIKQIPENIKAAIFGNVGSKIVFRISEEDAKFLESSFAPTFSASDIMKLENLNAYTALLINNYPQKPFNIKESFPPHGSQETIDELKQLSYLKYGRPREEVEKEIMRKFNFNN